MPRPKKQTKAAKTSNAFLDAITFVGSVLKEQGTPAETHIYLSNNWAVAFNGILAAGCPIDNDIFACPNYFLFQQALSKCGEKVSIEPLLNYSVKNNSDLDPTLNQNINIYTEKLIIQSDKFKAIIPCIDPTLISVGSFDPLTVPLNDEFKKALEIVAPLVNDNGQQIYNVSILMNGQSLVSSEQGSVILEAWHGNELPTNIAIPKSLTGPLKTAKKIVGFGYSDFSVTFHFEDKSFIKSQIYSEKWPDVNRILNIEAKPFEIPKGIWDGLNAVSPFSTDGLVYFDNGVLRSHRDDNMGASYAVEGLPRGPIFSIKQLMTLKDHMKMVDFFCHGPNGVMTVFYGDKCRGVIASRNG